MYMTLGLCVSFKMLACISSSIVLFIYCTVVDEMCNRNYSQTAVNLPHLVTLMSLCHPFSSKYVLCIE